MGTSPVGEVGMMNYDLFYPKCINIMHFSGHIGNHCGTYGCLTPPAGRWCLSGSFTKNPEETAGVNKLFDVQLFYCYHSMIVSMFTKISRPLFL